MRVKAPRGLPPLPVGCSEASPYDSRNENGIGWYCCQCNGYNLAVVRKCSCGHRRCKEVRV